MYSEEQNINGQKETQQSTLNEDLVVGDIDVPYGWRHKLDIKDKSVKQSKLFKILNIEATTRQNALPTVSQE